MSNITLKNYENNCHVNYALKKAIKRAVNDDEWDLRYTYDGLSDFSILIEDIDKIIAWSKNHYEGDLYINCNLWYICRDCLDEILKAYALEVEGYSENEKVFPSIALF